MEELKVHLFVVVGTRTVRSGAEVAVAKHALYASTDWLEARDKMHEREDEYPKWTFEIVEHDTAVTVGVPS